MVLDSKLAFWPYTLHGPTNIRQGALIKVTYSDGRMGYADCHPWPELDDLPLNTQLELLKKGTFTTLTTQSLLCAQLDAEARFQKKHLIHDIEIPLSHCLIVNLCKIDHKELENFRDKGFTTCKVKMGNNLPEEIKALQNIFACYDFEVRLDFNEKLTFDQASFFIKEIKNLWHKIDFIEDPCPYDAEQWQELQKRFPIALAADRACKKALGQIKSAAVLVIKPAIEAPFTKPIEQRVVYTSYLDHSIGQMYAACHAARHGCKEICGLLSHLVYKRDPFSSALVTQGPRLLPALGTGLGFNELLESTPWKMLA